MDFLGECFRWLRRSFAWAAPPLAAKLPPVGVLLLAIAAGFGLHSWIFARSRVRATATITENAAAFDREGGVAYTPRFRLRLPDGGLIVVQAARGSEEIEFPAGEQVPVLYRAGDPQGAMLTTPWLVYQGAIVFGVLGVFMFDLGWAPRVKLRRGERAAGSRADGGS